MKKLLLICLLFVSANSFAQGLLKRLSFGLKAGANYSDYTNAEFTTEGLVGFHAGALVNLKLTDKFSIQEEFLFSSQGAKMNNDLFGQQQDLKVYYMTVPILVKYRTNFGLYVEAGPQVGARIKEDPENKTVGEFAKKLDMTVVGGLGYQMKNGFGFGARYVYGLTPVSDYKIANVKTDAKTTVVQGSVFYIF
jgi:hypothetical protein